MRNKKNFNVYHFHKNGNPVSSFHSSFCILHFLCKEVFDDI